MNIFDSVKASEAERTEGRCGDDLVAQADVVMDRAFTVPGTPEEVWPWIVQLGKSRAGWYLGRRAERLIPPRRRAIRQIDPRWQRLAVGDVIPDYGGPDATFTVAKIRAPNILVYRSVRRAMEVTWSITVRTVDIPDVGTTARSRVLLRLRLGPVKRRWLAASAGDLIDRLTIAGMAAGLRERLEATAAGPR